MELLTPRLRLREFEVEDWHATWPYESDPEVVRYGSYDVQTPEQSQKRIQDSMAAVRELPRRIYDLAVVLREDGRLIGRCGMKVTDFAQREGALWYTLDRSQWSQGYITEASEALLDFGFGTLGLHRVWADCDPRNLGSVGVVKKLGFRPEAHFRENVFLKGEWCDSLIYAILDREWAAHPRLYPQGSMELVTPRLRLRELEEEDWRAIWAYESDPDVVRYLQDDVRTPKETLKALQESLAKAKEVPRPFYDLAVVLREDGRLIGRCRLTVIHGQWRNGWLGFILDRSQWRKGYMTEAAEALLDFGFGTLQLGEVSASCDSRNGYAMALLGKLGFHRAFFREGIWIKGESTDMDTHVLPSKKWAERREPPMREW